MFTVSPWSLINVFFREVGEQGVYIGQSAQLVSLNIKLVRWGGTKNTCRRKNGKEIIHSFRWFLPKQRGFTYRISWVLHKFAIAKCYLQNRELPSGFNFSHRTLWKIPISLDLDTSRSEILHLTAGLRFKSSKAMDSPGVYDRLEERPREPHVLLDYCLRIPATGGHSWTKTSPNRWAKPLSPIYIWLIWAAKTCKKCHLFNNSI